MLCAIESGTFYLLTNFLIMKNLFFVFVFVFGIQTTVFSQDKINIDDLIGYWQPDQVSSQLFFWKDVNGNLQMQEISGTSGDPIDLVSLKINDDSIVANTIYTPNHWETETKYTFKDKNTLESVICGDGEATITLIKVK